MRSTGPLDVAVHSRWCAWGRKRGRQSILSASALALPPPARNSDDLDAGSKSLQINKGKQQKNSPDGMGHGWMGGMGMFYSFVGEIVVGWNITYLNNPLAGPSFVIDLVVLSHCGMGNLF